MELVAAIGGLAFILASLIVGGRMIALSFRTRQLPELMMGLGLFLMGGLGYPLMVTAQVGTGLSDTVRTALVASQMLCTVVGHCCLAVFTQRVFRRDSRWARMAVGVTIAALIAGFAFQAISRGLLTVAGGESIFAPFTMIGIVNLIWAATESALYHRQMGRRLSIGLAEPLLVDRFRLWTIAIGTAAVTASVSLGFELAGVNMAVSALGASIVAPLGLTTAAALWLAFWPPARYAGRFAASSA